MARWIINRHEEHSSEDENNRIRLTLDDNSIAQCLQYFSRGYVGFHLTKDEKLKVKDPGGNESMRDRVTGYFARRSEILMMTRSGILSGIL